MKVWLGLCALLGVLSVVFWLLDPPSYAAAQLPSRLSWDAARWPQRPWTLWTASLVHLSGSHLVANLLALAALAVLGAALHAQRSAALALFIAWPLGTASLMLWPGVAHYRGLSGLIHAAVLALWAHTAINSIAKPVSFVLLAGIGLKLMMEHAWSQPMAFDPDWGFNVVYAAHLGGAAAGAVCGLLCCGLALGWRKARRGQAAGQHPGKRSGGNQGGHLG
ncbi:MAG TPA: rhombosortase [Burkholderiaceae bacterium]|nr:rhombosortase [Burkholderiaceae bacterium]